MSEGAEKPGSTRQNINVGSRLYDQVRFAHESGLMEVDMSSSRHGNDPLTILWVAVGVLFSLLVGAGAGVLAWLGGVSAEASILTAGGAFGGSLTLCVLIISLLKE